MLTWSTRKTVEANKIPNQLWQRGVVIGVDYSTLIDSLGHCSIFLILEDIAFNVILRKLDKC